MAFPTVQRLRETNTAGGCKLQLVPVGLVASVPPEIQGTIATEVTLSSGSWIDVLPTHFTQQFAEEWQLRGGDQVARAEVRAVIPKDRALLLHGLWGSKYHRYLVLHHDRNGTMKLMGRPEQPAMVRIVQLDHGADPRRDRNQYELQVVVTRRSPCPFYLASPPVSGGGGPGDPATVQSAAGSPLYSTTVASGGTLTLPTANVIKADGTDLAVEYRPAATSDIYIEQNHIEVLFAAGDGDTLELTINPAKAGTYSVLAQDGSSGTITFSKNGGAFGAMGAGIALADTDTIQVRRTATGALGWVRISTNNA